MRAAVTSTSRPYQLPGYAQARQEPPRAGRVPLSRPGGAAFRQCLARVVAGEVHEQEHEHESEPGDDERAGRGAEDPVVHLAAERVMTVRLSPEVVADPQDVDDDGEVQPRPPRARPPHACAGGFPTGTSHD